MSSQPIPLRCRGCDYASSFLTKPLTLRYQLSAGETVDIRPVLGWCHKCETHRDIEPGFDLGSITSELESLSQRRGAFSSLRAAFAKASPEDEARKAHLNSLYKIACERKSPPRCITCGSDKTVPLKFGPSGICTSFVHTCGDRLQIDARDANAPRLSLRHEVVELDPEGKNIHGYLLGLSDFLAFLQDRWQMKDEYARAFVNRNRGLLPRLHQRTVAELEQRFDLSRPENRLLAHTMPSPIELSIVRCAYTRCMEAMDDDTAVENTKSPEGIANWAVLWNRSDLVREINPSLEEYLRKNGPEMFDEMCGRAFEQ